MKLREALEECTLALLRKIAANHGAAPEETALRSELVDKIFLRLLDPSYLDGYLAKLSSVEKWLLRTIQAHSWTIKAFVLDRQFPASARATHTREQSETSPRVSLAHKGILYRSFAPLGDWRGEVYHIPEELRTSVAASLPPDTGPAKPDLKHQPAPELVFERNSPFDLFCLLSFLQSGNRRLVRGVLGRSEINKLEQEVSQLSPKRVGDQIEERWIFLLHLALVNGWLIRRGNSLHPTRNVPRILTGPHSGVRARLLDAYCKDQNWSDLSAAGKVRQALGSRRIDERAGRRLLLHYLEELSDGSWIEEKAFSNALRATNPDFLREDYASPTWGIVDVATEAEVYGLESWDLVEGEWLRFVLYGPFHWLGAIRYGKSLNGEAAVIQFVSREAEKIGVSVTHPCEKDWAAEGETFTQRSALSAQHSALAFCVQKNIQVSHGLEVSAPADGDLALLYRLEPYMELISRGKTNCYRMTKTSVLAALEAGNSWEQLRGLLQPTRGVTIAEGALQTLEEWATEYGRYVLEMALLIWASTPEDLDRLNSLPQANSYLGPRLGGNSIRVAPERVWELLQAMKQAGLFPRVDPSVKRQGSQWVAANVDLLKESLFALKLMRGLHGEVGFRNSSDALRRLETALDPEDVEEVSRRVQEIAKRLGGSGNGG